MYKSDEEIARLRMGAAFSDAGMRALVGIIVQGIAARRSRPLPIPTSRGRS
jgi:Xaa-Pro aminopeptidase